MGKKFNPEICRLSDGPNPEIGFKSASHSAYSNLDLSRADQATLEKLGFAIAAINRWNAFVETVGSVEKLMKLYEDSVCAELGGKRNE
jgi:hypothetical protein